MAREVTLVDAGLGNMASVERALIQVGAAVRVTSDPDQVARSRMVVFPGQSAFGAATQAIVDGAMGAALRMVIERGDPFLGICLGMQLLFDGSEENGGREGLHVLPGYCRRFPDGMTEAAEAGAEQREIEPAPAVADPEGSQTAAGAAPANGAPAPAVETAPTGPLLGHDELENLFAPTPAATPVPAPTEVAAPAGATLTASPMTSAAPDLSTMAAPAEPAPVVPAPPRTEPLVRHLKVPHMGWNDVEPTGDHYYFVHSYYVEPARPEDVMWVTTYGSVRFPAAVRRNNVLGCQFHPEKSQRAGLKFLRAFLLGGWG